MHAPGLIFGAPARWVLKMEQIRVVCPSCVLAFTRSGSAFALLTEMACVEWAPSMLTSIVPVVYRHRNFHMEAEYGIGYLHGCLNGAVRVA